MSVINKLDQERSSLNADWYRMQSTGHRVQGHRGWQLFTVGTCTDTLLVALEPARLQVVA